VRIKVCGITRYEDAKIAAHLGVDALGFIFYPKSTRYIQPGAAREIVQKLPPFVSRVGVFVNEDARTVNRIAGEVGLDTVQFHGDESPEYCDRFTLSVIKAFSVAADFDLSIINGYHVNGILLDTWDRNSHGGTGKSFDWRIAQRATGAHDTVVLAGGLGPSNLVDALDAVHPYAVDLNSGVEIKPGEKNPHKLRDAVRIIRSWSSS
jgi:phosphoribosylanthranilate isomerase